MIEDLKPYSEYKESGLPWLGKVPRHWGIKRAKSILQPIDERSMTGREELLTVSSARGVVPRKTATVTMFKAESYLGYKLCWPGDLVINSLWAWAGGLAVSSHHGIISSAYGVYRIRQGLEMIPAFLHEVVRSSSFSWELKVRSKGVWISRLQLTDLSFLDAPIHIPPPAEQAAIVRFLAWACWRLDEAIRAKRKVIALLNEQKQVIIHRVVTQGLDPYVTLKPSSIPWLGDIPQHWEVRRLRFAVDHYGPGIQMGPFGSSLTDLQSSETGFKLFGQENTISGDFTRGSRWITKEQFEQLRKYELVPGDMVLTRKGSIGKARLVPDGIPRGIADSDTIRVRLDERTVDASFIVMLLHSSTYVQRQLEATRRGAVLGGLNTATIGNLVLVLPPRPEQLTLHADLRDRTRGLVAVVSRVEREIELLREYRTRLVADVVTGKLDVRDAAARLPDDPAPGATEGDDELSGEAERADEEAAA